MFKATNWIYDNYAQVLQIGLNMEGRVRFNHLVAVTKVSNCLQYIILHCTIVQGIVWDLYKYVQNICVYIQ